MQKDNTHGNYYKWGSLTRQQGVTTCRLTWYPSGTSSSCIGKSNTCEPTGPMATTQTVQNWLMLTLGNQVIMDPTCAPHVLKETSLRLDKSPCVTPRKVMVMWTTSHQWQGFHLLFVEISWDRNVYGIICLGDSGWPQHRENRGNREFGSYFFQTGKTQGILLWHRENIFLWHRENIWLWLLK